MPEQSIVEVLGVDAGCSFAIKLVATIFSLLTSKFPACLIFNVCFQKSSVKSFASSLAGGQRCSLCSMERRKALRTGSLPGNDGSLHQLILVVTSVSDVNP